MARPIVALVNAPGTNCLLETQFAFEQAGAATELVSLAEIQTGASKLSRFAGVVLAGGFSFADDLGAGRVLAALLRNSAESIFEAFLAKPRPILGICNGFQVLLELGALGVPRNAATLAPNAGGRFECRWTELKSPLASQTTETSNCPYFTGLDQPFCWPIAHAEGRFVAETGTLERLQNNGQIALSYCAKSATDFPCNPNGSLLNVAGLCDESGYILGLMPHPERCLSQYLKPERQRSAQQFFRNIVAAM